MHSQKKIIERIKNEGFVACSTAGEELFASHNNVLLNDWTPELMVPEYGCLLHDNENTYEAVKIGSWRK